MRCVILSSSSILHLDSNLDLDLIMNMDDDDSQLDLLGSL